jgi:hypothetical protein
VLPAVPRLGRLLMIGTFVAVVAARAAAAPSGPRTLAAAEAEALLRQAARVDPQAARVLKRVAAGYGKLTSLRSAGRSGDVGALASLKRPLFFHLVRRTPEGELVALAVCDGRRYYEYTERTRRYVEREAALLTRVAVPPNVRPFLAGDRLTEPMVALDGKPAVRDYRFRYGGRRSVGNKRADVLSVSTMTRGRGGTWQTFEGTRWYDAVSGLLLRTTTGARTTDYQNKLNPALKTDDFRWRPIPGAVKGLG